MSSSNAQLRGCPLQEPGAPCSANPLGALLSGLGVSRVHSLAVTTTCQHRPRSATWASRSPRKLRLRLLVLRILPSKPSPPFLFFSSVHSGTCTGRSSSFSYSRGPDTAVTADRRRRSEGGAEVY